MIRRSLIQRNKSTLFLLALLFSVSSIGISNCQVIADQPDIVIADFEGSTYGDWQTTGKAFGEAPAQGSFPKQMKVAGFEGKQLVNSYGGGDGPNGTLTSAEFKIERPWINFLIGGGGYEGETCINLRVSDSVVRSATGSNTKPGGSEDLQAASWDVKEFVGKSATIQIVDDRSDGWGHINVDQIVQSEKRSAAIKTKASKMLTVDGSHLIVPIANYKRGDHVVRLQILDGYEIVQNFTAPLPLGDDPRWLAAYPLDSFDLAGKTIQITPDGDGSISEKAVAAFESIRIGSAEDAQAEDDYDHPYRNQFHASTRRGWNNDPNGMVYHDGKYHLYYQHNPFGIFWGNMHWGHFESPDLVNWKERPIALVQNTTSDMMFSGGGFVDVNDTAGYGKDTLFVAFTSTGRGECLAYSTDGGRSFKEIDENPVVKHNGRDPKIIWYEPEQKWVMVIYDNEDGPEIQAIKPNQGTENRKLASIEFWESKDLHNWNRTGAFTDADRTAVYECPEFFELPIEGETDQSRWILYGAQNRYFIGTFDGKVFKKESGPHGDSHGAFYAAQTFSDVPDGRRIQIGWVTTSSYEGIFPDQISNQAFTLAHTMTLRRTDDGLRMFYYPVTENQNLRQAIIAEGSDLSPEDANKLLAKCEGELTEVQIEFAENGKHALAINGIDAGFDGTKATIFTDRTFNEVYVDDGIQYSVRRRDAKEFKSTRSQLEAGNVKSLKVWRLKSIWK